MAPKRKFSDIDPDPAVPPSLPPSVEEAYRRKCVQLKNRTNEVEDANDAARLRLARIKRQVEKLRVERAFLLEQLSKRTSANVEDSEGSPSPPPTPKDKPLRIKRGHRKSALMDLDSKATPTSSFKEPASPSESQAKGEGTRGTPINGVRKPSKKPKSAFELYCVDARPALEEKNKDEDGDGDNDADIDDELARSWEDLPAAEREEFHVKFDELTKKADEKENDNDDDEKDKEDKDDDDAADETPEKDGKTRDKPDTQDEDVEMTNYDTEDQDQDQDGETQMDRDGDDD
ncbi:hypothetical protein QQS21_011084 [Conoideocrella luteorostrata]|uniref:HMG box domain-containing protein n=1 Tax=Conoideocrella luteorostrata TaxID=1105319 RepID=A0AAJ0CDW9_9HYPO|nr:hypothetical protein QQS21_011084 [Conoideocrella luteorostrata]